MNRGTVQKGEGQRTGIVKPLDKIDISFVLQAIQLSE